MADILPGQRVVAVSLTGATAGQLTPAFYTPLNRAITKITAQIETLTQLVTAVSDANGNLIASTSLQVNTAELSAISAIQGAGFTVRDPAGNWHGRTFTDSVSIAWTNGDGTGNPSASLSPTYPGQTSIVTLGTITTGTWNAGVVAAIYGGTGIASYTAGNYINALNATTLQQRTPVQVLSDIGAEPAIAAGTTAQYWRGDKTWRSFATDVLATVIAGLSTATATAITAADTVLSALGKLQGQITANVTSIGLKADKSITISTTAPITGGGDLSANRTLAMPAATSLVSGYLTTTDWNTFNGKGSGTVTGVTGTAPVVSSGGSTPAISMAAATATVPGYLLATDWATFNGKQAGNSKLTDLSGLTYTGNSLKTLRVNVGETGWELVAAGGVGTLDIRDVWLMG